MSDEFRKDLLLLCLLTSNYTYGMSIAIFYTYFCSMFHEKNFNVNYQNFYFSNFAFALGMILGSRINSNLIKIVGVKLGFVIAGLMNMLCFFFSYSCSSYFLIILAMIFPGMNHQISITCQNVFISEKYKNGIINAKYFAMCRLCFALLWGYIMQTYVNPLNEKASIKDQFGDYYYSAEINT